MPPSQRVPSVKCTVSAGVAAGGSGGGSGAPGWSAGAGLAVVEPGSAAGTAGSVRTGASGGSAAGTGVVGAGTTRARSGVTVARDAGCAWIRTVTVVTTRASVATARTTQRYPRRTVSR